MPIRYLFFFLSLVRSVSLIPKPTECTKLTSDPRLYSDQEHPFRKAASRLSKPLIGDDGRIYTCSERNLFAFETNGSIAWSMHLNYACNVGIAPVQGGRGKIYLVAENRVLKINYSNTGTYESAGQVFFGPGPGQKGADEIIGLSISMPASSVYINIKNRGLFAYLFHGVLLWSAGPVIYRSGYRQGCKKNLTACYFSSVPVIDRCEASIYISNTEGELYALSVRSPYFKWIQDFSSFDKVFIISTGNNGRLYVTIPVRALMLALDVNSGNVMWQRSTGPLSSTECEPVVDANGWISIGSLDGFLYSFSPTGVLTKFSKAAIPDSVIQVSPVLDCSGFGVYISQTEMDGKISRIIGDYTYVSATKPRNVVVTLLVPATGSIYWSENYPDKFLSLFSNSDLHHFVLDERILLAFVAASKTGNPLACRSTYQKFSSSCSQAMPRRLSIYTGNERAILLFLLLETVLLIALAGLVRFCCIFWRKKKLQSQHLGNFLEKRRSLQLKKKAFDMTITELEQKAAEAAPANEVLEKLGDLVREREGIERKLSTTYSFGRDGAFSNSKSLLPSYDGKSKSYSFQGSKKESVTIFHTLSATSSGESISGRESSWDSYGDDKAKGKVPIEEGSDSDDAIYEEGSQGSASSPASSSEVSREVEMLNGGMESTQNSGGSTWLKRRGTLFSIN